MYEAVACGGIIVSLGEFILQKRRGVGLSLRKLALDSDISATYLSDIESGRKNNVSGDVLEKLSKALNLSEPEREEMYTLVGQENNTIPIDVQEFVKQHPDVLNFLREVKRGNHKEWLNNIENNENA